MAGSRINLEMELDRLFALRPQAFVTARNALAARLRASGDALEAGRIKSLKRPSVPAWAVNQLRFEAPRVLAALLASADRVRSRPTDMPDALQTRRNAVAEARKRAAGILVAGGHPATPQTMQRVSSTLEALATYGDSPDRGVAGRLTEELPAPGFDDLAALGILRAAAAGPRVDGQKEGSSRVPTSAPATTPHRIAEMESSANKAKEVADTKKKEAERAHASLLEAQGRAETLKRKRQDLEKALAEAKRDERANEGALSAAREAARKAGRAVRRRPARPSP